MSRIQIQNLTFSYDGSCDTIFENVSFQIDTDWKLGFTGRNGRGKTTFLNLLLGKYEYSGKITSPVEFGYFPFDLNGTLESTLDEIRALGIGCDEWEVEREIGKLGLRSDVLARPLRTLSKGEQTKIKLAALFLKEIGFLLIDEPTNHLDENGRALLASYLAGKKGFILVSHDRALLDAATDHTLSINKTNIEIQRGNFSSWYRNRALRDQFEAAENERLQKEIRRLETAAAQAKHWADQVEASKIGGGVCRSETKSIGGRAYIGEKSRRMQQRRKNLERSRQRAVEEKSALLHDLEKNEELRIRPLSYRAELLAEFRGISVFFGENVICDAVRFQINRGDRIALHGENGCGKSSLLKLLLGEAVPYRGEFYKASGLKISYIPQDASFLQGSPDAYAEQCGVDRTLFQTILRKLDFSRLQFEKDMACYSEGQKKKVLIARSLCEEAHLYIWDEPLNYIDVFSRLQIEELVSKYRPTLLFVEHDRVFREKTATKTVEVTRAGRRHPEAVIPG
ncbi:MAG: ABC-F type ribosomal protection protein [Clostridiales bacterium]|nr:MAG: ABC-F type ribosomal protection protein [Clostridiales bacterium]